MTKADSVEVIVRAPMRGNVIEVMVRIGDSVIPDQELLILESMKMEIPVLSPSLGMVSSIAVSEGVPVIEDGELLTLKTP